MSEKQTMSTFGYYAEDVKDDLNVISGKYYNIGLDDEPEDGEDF